MKTSRSYISFNVFTNSFRAMLLHKLDAPRIDLCRLMSSRCVGNKPINRSASTGSQTRGRTDITDDDSENISTKFLSKHEFPDKLCGKNCHHVLGVTTVACVESKIWFNSQDLIIFKKYHDLPSRLPLVKAQRSFLSGICPSTQLHRHKVKVTSPPIKKTEIQNSQGFSFEVGKIPLRFKLLYFPYLKSKTLRVPNFRFFIGGAVTFTLCPWS